MIEYLAVSENGTLTSAEKHGGKLDV